MNLSNIDLNSDRIFKKLNELDTSKSGGSDKIPPFVWFNCSPTLSLTLNLIFTISLNLGNFQLIGNVHLSYLCDRTDVKNCRPISGLYHTAKIFESIVVDLVKLIRPIITPHQPGFIPGRSCQINLICYAHVLM